MLEKGEDLRLVLLRFTYHRIIDGLILLRSRFANHGQVGEHPAADHGPLVLLLISNQSRAISNSARLHGDEAKQLDYRGLLADGWLGRRGQSEQDHGHHGSTTTRNIGFPVTETAFPRSMRNLWLSLVLTPMQPAVPLFGVNAPPGDCPPSG